MIMDDLKNKNIALFGNGMSCIYHERPNIDSEHDVYIRINKGSPKRNEIHIGSKTDIVALSLNLDEEQIEDLYGNVEKLIYCSPKNREFLNDYLKNNCDFYPEQNWNVLNGILGSRPSTGIMMIDFLWCYSEFKELHLFGFDGWNTPNIYTNNNHIGPNDPMSEREYIDLLIKNSKKVFRHE